MVESPEEAQLVLINSCAFIAPATEESVRVILECARDLAEMPESERPLLAVAGCLPGRFGAPSLAGEIPEVDLWLESSAMNEWPALVAAALKKSRRKTHKSLSGLTPGAGRVLSTGPSYAWLKISEGCGQSCSFCTIPMIRGKVRSSTADELVLEARALLAEGVKELVLVAQDLTSWGRDLPEKPGLIGLLERLLPLDGLERLRMMYLYPAGLTDDLLSFAASAGPGLVPYFDVPLQHSHPDILTRMGRPFAQSPMKVLERIRKYLPEAALRTSLITGFPGEGEAEFEHLCRFVEEARFQNLGVFAYQVEEGTLAAGMPGQLPDAVKSGRRARIMEIQ
jgi:tRNA-2-methylthio-N6-dimethylallyladenosine synthase/ribosomal protein S12 methylthiotransferase